MVKEKDLTLSINAKQPNTPIDQSQVEPGKINIHKQHTGIVHMPDEKQAFETARLAKVEDYLKNGTIERATTELRLDTYKQIQNCFLGLCMFFGLVTLLMQQTDLHKQMTSVRQTLLRSPADSSQH